MIQRNKIFFANDARFLSRSVCSVIVSLMCSLRRVETESRFFLRTLYASLPWFCVQLDFYVYYTEKFAAGVKANDVIGAFVQCDVKVRSDASSLGEKGWDALSMGKISSPTKQDVDLGSWQGIFTSRTAALTNSWLTGSRVYYWVIFLFPKLPNVHQLYTMTKGARSIERAKGVTQ